MDILIEALADDTKLRSWTYNEIWANSLILSDVKDAESDEKKFSKFTMTFRNAFPKFRAIAF